MLIWGRFRTTWNKNHYFTSLSGQAPLRSNIAMATPQVPDDQTLFERVCYMLKLKVTKCQQLTLNGIKKKTQQIPPPIQKS